MSQSIYLSFELRKHGTLSIPVGGDGNTVLTFTKTCGLPLITERGDCWELALSREYREVESSKKIDAHQIY